MKTVLAMALACAAWAAGPAGTARNRQDRPALERLLAADKAAANAKPEDAAAQYRASLTASYAAEVALEQRDRDAAKRAAETGIQHAERAVSLDSANSEYHRVLGTLCGQAIPANVLAGLRYGKRAREAIDKAIELDPKSAQAYLARGVGNYYLPAMLGGGPEKAVEDFRRAIQLDAKLADAHLWLGLALRELNRNAEARNALTESLRLNPDRQWARQQLEKTPAQ
jgi:tetratricopeptide (TPR) repeat protein